MALYISDANGQLKRVSGNQKTVDLTDVYPVGSIYMSINSTSPASLFGGSWTELDSNKALWVTSTSSGNANTTINAGLPNITGSRHLAWADQSGGGLIMKVEENVSTSALYATRSGNQWFTSSSNSQNNSNYYNYLSMDASRSNSIYGNSTTVQPPAYRVYAWRRTA